MGLEMKSVTDEQVFLVIAIPILLTWTLSAILIGINSRGSHWFQMRLGLNVASSGGKTMTTAKLPTELRVDARFRN